jgi:hypothetical protein
VTRHAGIVARGDAPLVESAVQPVAGPPTGDWGQASTWPLARSSRLYVAQVLGEGRYVVAEP